MQNTWKMTETLPNGYSYESTQRELSNEYPHDRVRIVFKDLCACVLWTKVAPASERIKVFSVFIFRLVLEIMEHHTPDADIQCKAIQVISLMALNGKTLNSSFFFIFLRYLRC